RGEGRPTRVGRVESRRCQIQAAVLLRAVGASGPNAPKPTALDTSAGVASRQSSNCDDSDCVWRGRKPGSAGLVKSLAQPGGNATGINFFAGEVDAKLFRRYLRDQDRARTSNNDSKEPTLRSLDKDAPFHRAIERLGVITSQPLLGGLHHQYCRI